MQANAGEFLHSHQEEEASRQPPRFRKDEQQSSVDPDSGRSRTTGESVERIDTNTMATIGDYVTSDDTSQQHHHHPQQQQQYGADGSGGSGVEAGRVIATMAAHYREDHATGSTQRRGELGCCQKIVASNHKFGRTREQASADSSATRFIPAMGTRHGSYRQRNRHYQHPHSYYDDLNTSPKGLRDGASDQQQRPAPFVQLPTAAAHQIPSTAGYYLPVSPSGQLMAATSDLRVGLAESPADGHQQQPSYFRVPILATPVSPLPDVRYQMLQPVMGAGGGSTQSVSMTQLYSQERNERDVASLTNKSPGRYLVICGDQLSKSSQSMRMDRWPEDKLTGRRTDQVPDEPQTSIDTSTTGSNHELHQIGSPLPPDHMKVDDTRSATDERDQATQRSKSDDSREQKSD